MLKSGLIELIVAVALSVGGPFVAASQAGSTDPVLGLGQASATVSSGQALLELVGTWAFDDIMQVNFPLVAVVSQGATFARFEVGAAAQSGIEPSLADGLQSVDIAAVEIAANPDPQAALLRLEPHNMTLALPPIFSDGNLSVVVYVQLVGEGTFLSNVVSTTLSGLGGTP